MLNVCENEKEYNVENRSNIVLNGKINWFTRKERMRNHRMNDKHISQDKFPKTAYFANHTFWCIRFEFPFVCTYFLFRIKNVSIDIHSNITLEMMRATWNITPKHLLRDRIVESENAWPWTSYRSSPGRQEQINWLIHEMNDWTSAWMKDSNEIKWNEIKWN